MSIGASLGVPHNVIVNPVETVEQSELICVPFVGALHVISVSVGRKLPTDDQVEHQLPQVGAACPAEEAGELSLQAGDDLIRGGLQQPRAAVFQVDPGFAFRLQEPQVGVETETL